MDFLGIRIDRNNRVAIVALADGAGEILLDCDEFVEIDAPALVNDAEAANAEHFLKPPFPEYGPGRQGLGAVSLAHCPQVSDAISHCSIDGRNTNAC